MRQFLKGVGNRMRLRNWSMMAWAMLAMILVFSASTVVVGIGLYAVTENHPQISTR